MCTWLCGIRFCKLLDDTFKVETWKESKMARWLEMGGDLATRGASRMCWLKKYSFIRVCTACTWLCGIRFCKLLDDTFKVETWKESSSLGVITSKFFTEKCSALPNSCAQHYPTLLWWYKCARVAPSTSQWTMWSLRDSQTLWSLNILTSGHPEVCKIWFLKVMYTQCRL